MPNFLNNTVTIFWPSPGPSTTPRPSIPPDRFRSELYLSAPSTLVIVVVDSKEGRAFHNTPPPNPVSHHGKRDLVSPPIGVLVEVIMMLVDGAADGVESRVLLRLSASASHFSVVHGPSFVHRRRVSPGGGQ